MLCSIASPSFSADHRLDRIKVPTTIHADHTQAALEGPWILTGHVNITQPGRSLSADYAKLDLDPKTKKRTQLTLRGHICIQQGKQQLRGETATFDLAKQTGELRHAAYRLPLKQLTAWGEAKKASLQKQITIHDATYSTCSTTNPPVAIKRK